MEKNKKKVFQNWNKKNPHHQHQKKVRFQTEGRKKKVLPGESNAGLTPSNALIGVTNWQLKKHGLAEGRKQNDPLL